MKHTIRLLCLTLCAAFLLAVPALAAETTPEPDDTIITAAQPLPSVRYDGTVTKQEDGSLLLSTQDTSNPEIIIHLPEDVLYVDGATGAPLDVKAIKDGDVLAVWVGPAMTMSLPPQTTAVLLAGNVPESGFQYAEITAPAKDGSFPIAGGELEVSETAEISPYITKNRITLADLTPGAQVLAWTGDSGKIDRIVMFPYAYAGYLTAEISGAVRLNGEELAVKGRVLQNDGLKQLYLPLRAAAEAAGYGVDWVPGRGAIVSASGVELFSVRPGSDTAQTAAGEHGLLGGCVVDNGVTYLPASDLAGLLQLYFYTE